MNPNNPLSQYFRQPAIYIKLPSQGNYYPAGTLEMPTNKELPVFPMTAIDEITYRTPDALFNGQAVVNVIESCVPNIKDAWAIPAVDLDTILVAIRIASYGHQMDFSTACPKCNNDDEYGIDLRTVLDSIRSPDYTQPIKQGDIEIYFRPMTYKNMSDNNRMQFDEQRLFQNINLVDGNADVKKIAAISDALKKMTEMTIVALSQSIMTIKTPTAMVNEPEFIQEFMKNCDRSIFNRIQEYVIQQKQQAEMQPLTIMCKQCSTEYQQQLTLDMSSFFERAS
jgi:hypothetical protein